MIHCSGGAQTKVLNFIDDIHVIKDNMFPVPPLFRIIQKLSGTSWQEMYRVFNMGHRFEIYLQPSFVEIVLDIAASFNLDARVIGHCEPEEEGKLTIKNDEGEFYY